MARILICHVPKDGSLARDLGAALMGRGHFVSFDGEPDSLRPERSSRLRQFEAVIVLWTESSAQSVGLTEIARETLPLNVLVPLRAEELAITRLPLMFRKLNMLPPRDTDGISRLVARLSSAAASLREMSEREAAERTMAGPGRPKSVYDKSPAATPVPPRARGVLPPGGRLFKPTAEAGPVAEPAGVRVRPLSGLPEVEPDPTLMIRQPARARPAPPPGDARAEPPDRHRPQAPPPKPATQVLSAEDLAHAVETGLLAHHIPEAMWLGAPTSVEIMLGREVLADLLRADGSYGVLGQSIETLSVSLYGSAGGFEIERQSERTQFVNARYSGREPALSGGWAWLVTPRAVGVHELVVRVSALLRDSRGVPVPVVVPDRSFTTEVQIPEDENLVAALAGWYRR